MTLKQTQVRFELDLTSLPISLNIKVIRAIGANIETDMVDEVVRTNIRVDIASVRVYLDLISDSPSNSTLSLTSDLIGFDIRIDFPPNWIQY